MSSTSPRERLEQVLADLTAEGDQLDGWVADLPVQEWGAVTTPEGWTVAHQVGHLAWTDETSLAAVTDAEAFGALLKEAAQDPTGYVDTAADTWAAKPVPMLLDAWRAGREALADALRAVPDGERVPWFGPPMSPTSMASARFMETWAHAHDVAETFGIEVPRTDRVRHVCHLGVRTRDFAYSVHQQEPPAEPFRIELTAPSGETWTWGPEDAEQRVRGSAYDFCCLVTQRVHRDDTDLVAVGDDAEHWLTIAQAFAGPAGEGRDKK